MGLFEDDVRRDMADPAYAAGRRDAAIELFGVAALVQVSTTEHAQFPQAFSVASPDTVTSSTGAFLTTATLWAPVEYSLTKA